MQFENNTKENATKFKVRLNLCVLTKHNFFFKISKSCYGPSIENQKDIFQKPQ